MATNDVSERSLGTTTAEIQKFSRISHTNAAAVGQMKINGHMFRPLKKKTKKQTKADFFLLSVKT